jgi:hypothetical protein
LACEAQHLLFVGGLGRLGERLQPGMVLWNNCEGQKLHCKRNFMLLVAGFFSVPTTLPAMSRFDICLRHFSPHRLSARRSPCLRSRSLLGATAFPYRHTHNNNGGGAPDAGGELQFQCVFAIDCSKERGLDTEKIQIDMKANSLWRPGEKALSGFAADRVLGWTRIVRMGQPKSNLPAQTGWSFKFIDSKWTWLRPPGGQLQTYREDELGTWAPGVQYNISES